MTITRVSSSAFRKVGHYIIIISPLNGDRPYLARDDKGKTLKFIDNTDAHIHAGIIRERLDVATDVQYRGSR